MESDPLMNMHRIPQRPTRVVERICEIAPQLNDQARVRIDRGWRLHGP